MISERFIRITSCLSLIIFLLSSTFLLSQETGKKSRSLKEALFELEKKYNASIFYKSNLLEGIMVTEQAPDEKPGIEEQLKLLLQPLGLKYEKIGKAAFLIEATESFDKLKKSNTVKGLVLSEDGERLFGVHVKIKGSGTATLSNEKGEYSLEVKNLNDTLVFSYMGFIPKEEKIAQRQAVDVMLRYRLQELREMVVIGYASQERRELTGSVTTIKSKTISQVISATPEALIQGRAAGVQVVNNAGNPGNEVMVRIRGNSTTLAANKPLYIIDGVPSVTGTFFDVSRDIAGGQHNSVLAYINPKDIESIEILKDASEASIYGSRGGNGIVLITTKKGKNDGKLKVRLDESFGIQKIIKNYSVLNASQYSAYAKEAMTNSGMGTGSLIVNTGYDTDWQHEIFRTAALSEHNISVSGADSSTSFFTSGSFYRQENIIKGSAFRRANIRVNVNHKFSGRFSLGSTLMASYTVNDRKPDGFSPLSVIGTAALRNPNLPVYDSTGRFSDDPNGIENPVRTIQDALIEIKGKRFIGNIHADYAIVKKLSFRTSLSLDYLVQSEDCFFPTTLQSYRGGNASLGASNNEGLLSLENMLTYKTASQNGKHQLKILLGSGHQQSRFRSLAIFNSNGKNDLIKNVSNGTRPFVRVYENDLNLVSGFSRINYTVNDKYLFTLSLRVDGSSKFSAPGKTIGAFPSVAAAWRVSEEPFMSGAGFIHDLKLRMSYGSTGNLDGLTNVAYKGILTENPSFYTDPVWKAQLDKLPDPDLRWERVNQADAGLDVSVFEGRINLSTDFYIKRSRDLLQGRLIRLDSGSVLVMYNNGKIDNRGMEISLLSKNLLRKFTWTSQLNFFLNRNTIIQMAENPADNIPEPFIYFSFGAHTITSIHQPGQLYGSFWGYNYEGVDPATGKVKYSDLNRDGKINDADKTIIGSPLPKHMGGISNDLEYKGIYLSFFLQWSYGNNVYNMSKAVMDNMTLVHRHNGSTDLLDRWKKPGDITSVPKAMIDSMYNVQSSRWVEDGSYLRLKNITLGYDFPAQFLKRIRFEKLSLYITAQNLFTFTRYSGPDPETQVQAGRSTILGVDWFVPPNPRTYRIGLSMEL